MTKNDFQLIEVNEGNVTETGFYCYMSKKNTEGYRRKLNWLKARFAEGLKIKMLKLPERGFIEYIPGEYAWRPVDAKGYMFIHCLWVVGRSKGKGLAAVLLNECIKDAQKEGMKGVAMITSQGNWLPGKKILLKNGFEPVDQAPPSFNLMVKKFNDYPSPALLKADENIGKYGKGLTVFRSDQCPYIDDAVANVADTAKELGIDYRVIDLKSSRDVQTLSPSAYGVFGIVYNGSLLSYHYLLKQELIKRIENLND
ncbi:MAG: GNAT family N-acetyltransferase [Bacteroidales bacterium]|nr:GNAT family N-acetyltransferase [Bacteroidales bacterium]